MLLFEITHSAVNNLHNNSLPSFEMIPARVPSCNHSKLQITNPETRHTYAEESFIMARHD